MCEYQFNANNWEDRHDLESPINGLWSCPHENYADADHCVFHLTEDEKDRLQPTSSIYYEKYRNKLDRRGRKQKQFVGAEIPKLDLHSDKIDSPDTHPINFAHSKLGDVNIHSSEIEQTILFSHANIQKWDATDAVFRKKCYFDGVKFKGHADFSRATFKSATVFKGTEFESPPIFLITIFKNAMFQGVAFKQGANFFSCEFTEGLSFNNTYLGEATLADVEVAGDAMFQSVSIKGQLDLNHFECQDVYFDFYSPETAIIDLTGAEIGEFTLKCPPNENILYNMMLSTLGNGSISTPNNENNPLYCIFFRDTIFRDFNFSRYYSILDEADWNLHTVTDEFEEYVGREKDIDNRKLESTYSKAKISADSTNSGKAVSEFLLKEKRFKRKSDLNEQKFSKWLSNLAFDITAGYGERSSRVVITSISVIVIFGEIYGILFGYQGEFWKHFLLSYTTSFQSFVTLVFGGGEELSSPIIRFLASIEGFLGAFLIALFVFSLTKSAER